MMEAFLTGKGLFEFLQTGPTGRQSLVGAVKRVFQVRTKGGVPKAANLFFTDLLSLFPTNMDMRNLLEVCVRVSPLFSQVLEQFRIERNEEEQRKKLSKEGRLALVDQLVNFKMANLSDDEMRQLCKILKPYGGPDFKQIKAEEKDKLEVARNNFPGVSYVKKEGKAIAGQVATEIKRLKVIEQNAVHKGIIKFLLNRSLEDSKFITILSLVDAARVMRSMHTFFSIQFNAFPFVTNQSPYSLQKLLPLRERGGVQGRNSCYFHLSPLHQSDQVSWWRGGRNDREDCEKFLLL